MLAGSDIFALIFVGFAAGILLNAKEWDSLAPSIYPSLSFYLSWACSLLSLLFAFGG